MLLADATQSAGNGYEQLLIVVASLVAVVISVMVWRTQRKAGADANKIAGEANRIAQKQTDLDVMEATIENLRIDLKAAQDEAKDLRTEVAQARRETRRLNAEATTAIANVSILSDFIRDHVPDQPFPRLRRVPDVG